MKRIIVIILLSVGVNVCLFSQTTNTVNIGILSITPGTIFSSLSKIENINSNDISSGTLVTAELTNSGNFYIYDDFYNEATVVSDASYVDSVLFYGFSGVQSIDGIEPISVSNVSFENSSIPFDRNNLKYTYEVSGNITVNHSAKFITGIIDILLDGSITFTHNISEVYGTSDSSYVHGTVGKIGGSQFEFPIGDGGYYRPLIKGTTNAGNDMFTSSYVYKSPSTFGGLNLSFDQTDVGIVVIDTSEYWIFNYDNSDTRATDIPITLTWSSETTTSEIINADPKYDWSIARWDTVNLNWIYYDSDVDELNKRVTSYVNDQGIFTLARVLKTSVDNFTLGGEVEAIPIGIPCEDSKVMCDVDDPYYLRQYWGIDTMKSRFILTITTAISEQVFAKVDFFSEGGMLDNLYSSSTLLPNGSEVLISSGDNVELYPNHGQSKTFISVDRNKLSPDAEGYLTIYVTIGQKTDSIKVLFSDDFDKDGFLNVVERTTCIKKTKGLFNEWYYHAKDDDADDDGISNFVESGNNWSDAYNVDHNGNCIPDFLDLDSNGDDIPDSVEKFPGFEIDSVGGIYVYPAVSPNGDNLGYDRMYISNILKYPKNEVVIFDRLGHILYKQDGYDNDEKSFKGYPNQGPTSQIVPMGTYYYYIKYYDSDNVKQEKSGFIEIRY